MSLHAILLPSLNLLVSRRNQKLKNAHPPTQLTTLSPTTPLSSSTFPFTSSHTSLPPLLGSPTTYISTKLTMPRIPLHLLLWTALFLSIALVHAQISCSPGEASILGNPTIGSFLPAERNCDSDHEYYLRISTKNGYSTPIFDTNFEVDGRLEICHNGDWYSFWASSDYPFTANDARVACRQLGNQYDYALTASFTLSPADTSDGTNEFGPYDLECEGDEATLTEVRSGPA